ncbi:hypothetical protein AGR2A_pa80005 [Agrobacterium genomosp. 2 str. CFBP 5494]|uniref:Uncharacterized protein n=1 Tax=Agrobacterium genomosp. 2 str. CFBP 5494 TaxID=1183436 RepID=A0A9W5F3C9_9HYPH|nr:hypothetical protein AGR2A_pa80005 [Agrobacterium genomosp. 2 str. CFBP 5494]
MQRSEYEYAFTPDWFAGGGYIRKDFDKPGLKWQFLNGTQDDLLRRLWRRHAHHDLHARSCTRPPVLPGAPAKQQTASPDDRCCLHTGPLGREGFAWLSCLDR